MSIQALPDIRKTILVHAPLQKVWEAVSTPEGLAAWFMPGNLQPVAGHEFILEAGPFGQSPCKVLEVEPEKRLSFAWGKDWTLTFELVQQGDQVEFTLIHSGWTAEQLTEFGEPHELVRGRMDGGWSSIVKKLSAFLEG